MFRVVIDKRRLSIENPFAGLTFREGVAPGKHRGATVSTEWVRRVVFGEPLAGLNAEARALVQVMAETGARVGEVSGLMPEDICLDDAVPHIRIRPNAVRALKTPSSARDLPLVGGAVASAAQLVSAGGVQRYLGKSVALSSAVNKYMKANNLFGDRQSLYSLRHAFQDRLISAEVPERLQAELMGHALDRPRYGAGPSLAHKREWLLKAAVISGG